MYDVCGVMYGVWCGVCIVCVCVCMMCVVCVYGVVWFVFVFDCEVVCEFLYECVCIACVW